MKQTFYRITPILIGIFCLFLTPGLAQNNTIDSLRNSIFVQHRDSNKVLSLVALSKALYNIKDYSEAKKFGTEALSLSKQLGYKSGTAESYFILARTENKLSNPAKGLTLFNQAAEIYLESNNQARLASLYNNVGLIYLDVGKYLSAIDFLKKSQELYERQGDKNKAALALNNLGLVNRKLSDHQRAAEHYFKALELFEETNNLSGKASINGNLANLYKDQKEFGKALKYNAIAKEQFQELNNKSRLATVINNVGLIYEEQLEFDSALVRFKKAYAIFSTTNNKQGMGGTLNNLGRIYDQKKEYALALETQNQALQISKEIDNNGYISGIHIDIGIVLTKERRFPEAYEHLMEALQIARRIKNKQRELDAYQELSNYFEVKGDYINSLQYYKSYTLLNDSIFNQDKNQQIAQLESNFEIKKREQDIKILKQQQAIQQETIKRQDLRNKAVIGGAFLLLLFAIYLYRVNQQKRKTNQLLSHQNQEINLKQQQIITINKNLQKYQDQLHIANQELQSMNARLETTVKKRTSELQKTNQELDTFLYQSSHALRRPIVHVKGLVQLARLEPNQEEIIGLYDKLDDTASRMDLMLKKLVMASEIYVTKPEVDAVNFEEIFKEIWQSLSESLKSENVSLEYNIPPGVNYEADRRLVKIMFLNLLENAVLYNEATKRQKALVNITLTDNTNSIDIKVNDNGIGITEEAIAHIFDLFTVGTDQTTGYGLGLYIVKKAVEKLQGLITVSSKRNQFTTFHITLPKNPDIG